MIFLRFILLTAILREPHPIGIGKRPPVCPQRQWISLPNDAQKRFTSGDEMVFYGSFEALQRAATDALLGKAMQPSPPKPFNSTFPIIAIDGGAGSGKTSTAKLLAQRRGWLFISTGEHYRTLTAYFRENKIAPNDSEAIRQSLQNLRLSTAFHGNEGSLALNGRIWASDALREAGITDSVSHYAQLPEIRQFLRHYQRQLPAMAQAAGFAGMVIEGRDMTSVVFPETPHRFILEADPEERTRRRKNEGLVDDVIARDSRDSEQMRCVDGVQHIDTTLSNLEEVIAIVENFLSRP